MADISYDKHGAVRLITINRADKMNSLDFAANDELIDIWHEFDRDEQARVAVITGAGDKSFCAGADLKTYTLKFAQAAAPEFRTKYTNGPGFGGITRNLDIDKPILAAVNGFAISGGFNSGIGIKLTVCNNLVYSAQ
jgi:enoyl-CoA hydratase/carnithine racemase